MSKETYSIPKGVVSRVDFEHNTIDLCVANATDWDISTAVLTAITGQQTDFEIKNAVTSNPNTQSHAATVARDASWAVLKTSLENLYNQNLLNNSAITDEEKQALYIHDGSGGGGTPAPAPITTPVVTLVSEEISVLHVVYADSATPNKHHKPANVAFCEIWGKIDVPAPTDPTGCTEHYYISRSHEGIVFDATLRSKTFYGFARWVNKNGKFGPWSGIFSANIP